VFSVYINFPPECWFVGISIIQKKPKTKTSILKIVKPCHLGLGNCTAYGLNRKIWPEETLKELKQTNRVSQKKGVCIACPLKCAKHRNICANTASSFFD
jgi:hypothetical protein